MPNNREFSARSVNQNEKQEIIDELKERIAGSKSVICLEVNKFTVEKTTQFRRELQEAAGDFQVVKNTLAKRAIKDTPFEGLNQFLVGPTGLVFCPGDAAGLAKVVTKYAKEFAQQENKGVNVKGGVIEGAVLDANGIQKVSTLPPRQQLLAELVGTLESPISGLVFTLPGIVNEFVYTLQAVADKKAES